MAGMTARIDIDDLDWDINQCAVTGEGPFTGEAVEYDPDGHLVAVVSFREGLKDGKETHFFPDGKVAFEGVWRYGAGGVGVHRSWYANGGLKQEAHYDDRGYLQRVERFAEDGTQIG